MRKIYAALLVLVSAGMVISGLLIIDHYFPEVSSSLLKCGPGSSPCSELSSSPYSEIFGVPVASFGFFFYIWMFFSMFLFWESGKEFRSSFVYLLLPVSIAGLLTDLYLGGLLIYLKIFCKYCVMTYIINIFLFIVAFLWYRKIKNTTGKWFDRTIDFFKSADKIDSMKFLTGAFLFFTTMLFLFIVSFSLYMKEASSFSVTENQSEQESMDDFFKDYKSQKSEKLSFPETKFTFGKAGNKLEIIVVTDPFCSACYSFHAAAGKILQKYKEDIYMKYYFYPLDAACNPDVKNTIYKNSCEAVKTITAYSVHAPFSEVYDTYYKNKDDLENAFQRDEIDYNYIHELFGMKEIVSFEKFQKSVKDVTEEDLKNMVNAAIDNKVEATPTFFVNGKRVEGNLPYKLIERIIEYELREIE